MKRWIAGLLALLMVPLGALATSARVEEAKQSVVRIYTEYVLADGSSAGYGTGSGFAVGTDRGQVSYFVTNRHVVDNSEFQLRDGTTIPVFSAHYYIITNDFQNRIPATVVHMSNRTDLAIIHINTPITDRKPATLRAFETLGGETVTTIGFPGSADSFLTAEIQQQLPSTPDLLTMNRGIVSRVISAANSSRGEVVQTDATINHGNSGGPMVDENGFVIGANTWGITLDESANIIQGTNFAVSSNEIIRMLEDERIPFLTSQGGISPWLIATIVLLLASAAAAVLIVRQLRSQQKKEAAQSKRTLVGTVGELAGKSYPLAQKAVVGRDPKRCQIRFPGNASGVSSVHCTLRFDGKQVTVTDESSSYGTFIGDTKLTPGKPTTLHRGQTLYIGSQKNGLLLK